MRQVHGGHAADADFTLDAVAAAEGGSETWRYVGPGCIKLRPYGLKANGLVAELQPQITPIFILIC
jgi:hypothetical protein